ncbi:sensor histidine kinase [Chitinimonas koreensis]|uniref:sensor histidine kinase n=1 Tax=Chitinimonas koreensis TaxID=356302 RepID=UPI0004156E5F|nr:histidine kinase [Chitinimonas koreensis]QNM94792.1 histidine kinase [Chitinimonas koreensis]
MWRRLVQWHRSSENEFIEVLRRPERAEQAGSRWNRFIARRLAKLTAIERLQLERFMVRYGGWRSDAACAALVALCCTIGALVHFAWPERFSLLAAVLLANCFILSLGFGVLGVWFNYRQFSRHLPRQVVLIVAVTVAGALCGALTMAAGDGRPVLDALARVGRPAAIAGLCTGLCYAGLIGLVSLIRNRDYEAMAEQMRLESERERLARRLSDERLKLLQAQIEPHFLFNTLGAVQQLAEDGAPRAAALTAHLIQFLRGSLAQMRGERVTLAEDFRLAEAYLRVMQARLGDRLQLTFVLPPALAGRELPAMMLLTLVENAVKHGIEPALRGGEIRIEACEDAAGLRVVVADSGVGLVEPWQEGVGLANVRERLQLLYGEAAWLSVAAGGEAGTVAAIHLRPGAAPVPGQVAPSAVPV